MVKVVESADDGFADFYRSSYRRLLRQVYLVTASVEEAEDVLQEAFVRAAMRWNRLCDYESPELWVRRVALNLAVDGRRRLKRRLFAGVRVDADQHAVGDGSEQAALALALSSLRPKDRRLLLLHHVLGLSVQEMAVELDTSVPAVKSRLHRARRALTESLSTEREQ